MAERGWALVTGAGRRIGQALALAAAQAGYDIVVGNHHAGPEVAAETVGLIAALGRRAETLAIELTDPTACAGVFQAAPGPVTLLVNSASVFQDDRIGAVAAEVWDQAQATNLRAPVLLAQAFAAALPEGATGQIVNVVDQRVLKPTPEFFSYAVSKAGLWAATQMLAQALAPAIRVNAIAPGPTLRSIHQRPEDFAAEAAAVPLGHGPTPQEIGQALAYLIDAPSVTGQMIAVDGGQHLAWRTPEIIDP